LASKGKKDDNIDDLLDEFSLDSPLEKKKKKKKKEVYENLKWESEDASDFNIEPQGAMKAKY